MSYAIIQTETLKTAQISIKWAQYFVKFNIYLHFMKTYYMLVCGGGGLSSKVNSQATR